MALHGNPTSPVLPEANPSPTMNIYRLPAIELKVEHVANIKSQKKRILTNEKARLRNQAIKSELKTYVRKTREAITAGDAELAEAALREACRKLDKAVSKGVIHKNQAANRKSKLAVQVAKLSK